MARQVLEREGREGGLQEVMTVEQTAAYLQIHKGMIYRYIREGLLPAIRLGKVYRLLRDDVEAFVQSRRAGGEHAE